MENLLSLKSKKYVSTYIHLSIFAKKIQNVFYFFPLRLPWTNSKIVDKMVLKIILIILPEGP